jgi:hypothetical protein
MDSYLLAYNAMYSVEASRASACYLLYAGFFLGLSFEPEDGGYMFLRNVGLFSTDYTALFSRR